MNPEQINDLFSSPDRTTKAFHSTDILSSDGNVLSTVYTRKLGETNTKTLHSTDININQEAVVTDTSTTIVSNENLSEKKYEFSYKELQTEVDKQVNGKLQDFLDKNEESINSIKNEVGHHKETVDTKVGSFQQVLNVLTNNKQFSISTTLTRVGLIVGAAIVIVQIYIEVINDKFNNITELQRDMSVLQTKVEKLEGDNDENSEEVKQIKDIINKINVSIAKLGRDPNQDNGTDTE